MTTILVVDDHVNKRKTVIAALIKRYEVAETDHPKLASLLIEKLQPSVILINQLSLSFDALRFFLNIKDQYPKTPVLLYALKCPDAIRILKQTLSMALGKKKLTFNLG